jgi:hypothetical protein
MASATPYRVETRRGEPIHVLDRTLIPVARVVSTAQNRGTIGKEALNGNGWVFVRARPLAVIETRRGHERVIRVHDVTRTILLQMALFCAVVSFVSVLLIARTHRRHKRDHR